MLRTSSHSNGFLARIPGRKATTQHLCPTHSGRSFANTGLRMTGVNTCHMSSPNCFHMSSPQLRNPPLRPLPYRGIHVRVLLDVSQAIFRISFPHLHEQINQRNLHKRRLLILQR